MTTVDIPGGTADIRDVSELTVNQRRMIERATFAASGAIDRIPDGYDKMSDDEKIKAVMSVGLTEQELGLFDHLQDVTIFVALISWTRLEAAPTTVDDLGEMPGPVYDALALATSKFGAQIAGRSVAPNPDKSSPTGPSSS